MIDITCTWVPGTTDTIKLSSKKQILKIKLRQVNFLLGKQAVNDLFLRGRYSNKVTQEQFDRLLQS